MEAVRERNRIFAVRVPRKDYSLFRSMTQRMGWEMAHEEYEPNTTTIRAMEDVRAGKVFHAESVEDLIAQLNA